MKKDTLRVIGVLACCITFVFLAACQSTDVGTDTEEVVPVETSLVNAGSLTGNQSISATTEALSEVALTPSINAEIMEVRVDKGDTVEEGQVLAVLDDTDLQHALEQERAAYERAKSTITMAEAGERGAQANAEQSRVALENADHAINQAREQYEQAQTNLKQAKENQGNSMEQAERSVASAERSLETAKRGLETAERERDRSQQLFDNGLISKQELEQAEEAVEDAKDNVQSAEDSLSDAEDNLEEIQQEYDIELLESDVEQARLQWEEAKDAKKELQTSIDSAEAAVDEAGGSIDDANAALEQARIAVEQAEENLADAVVRAPTSGKVLDMNGEPGEMYGGQEPILTLGELNALHAVANVTPNQLTLFEEGNEVSVRFPSVETETTGTVTHVASTADENGMFPVEVQVSNADQSLRAGIHAELLIEETYVKDSLLVPTEAVITMEGEPSVFVAEDNTAELVSVEVIREESDYTAVRADDLADGSTIVVRGQYFLTDGAAVEDVTEIEDDSEEAEEAAEPDAGGEDA
ncbi:RND family efflux transporter, MFP subunit [Alteribacillus persepolensis]|uniref:RND family efflux transporter, MFP subunit n=1 Tax=Alteribacillus persepolensis TaxID=568899 RepID=A0A1G8JRA4_9BACI|nr:efflux RND transporter periplasmic adaptor subunit [Alteribacillus persepolensis]SDI33557.1 RND family efflux transporter, MFP subunit [Alteribacillus persepolensis]